jgi:hypothetical protein
MFNKYSRTKGKGPGKSTDPAFQGSVTNIERKKGPGGLEGVKEILRS